MGAAPFRLAIVASHPIQYFGPWFRLLAKHPEIDLTVLFCCAHGQTSSYDVGFGKSFRWDRPLTDGYRHEFLASLHPWPQPHSFMGLINPSLWDRIHTRNFDAMLHQGWAHASCWIAVAAARAHGVRVMTYGESHLGSGLPRPPWKRLARRTVLGGLFRKSDAFLAVSKLNAEFYRAYGVDDARIFVAPYSVDNDFFTAEREKLLPQRDELRRELGVDDDRSIVVSSGKLVPRKAPLDLVQAFATVRKDLPAKLVFLGDGELRESVMSLARELAVADDVVITGFKQQLEMCRVYVAADLMAFPSHFDSWGLVLNEGMVFGLPAICSDAVTAHHDLIEEGVTGHVVASGDVEALAEKLRLRISDHEGTQAMGERARKRMSSWSFHQSVDAVVEALHFIMNRDSV